METVYSLAQRRSYPVHVPQGECLLMGIGVGILGYQYTNNRSAIRPSYLSFLDTFIGEC